MKVFSKIQQLNESFAIWATQKFGTMGIFWLFLIYGLLPLIPALSSKEAVLLYWSNWVQLWALPLLMVGTILLGRDAEKRALEDHENIKKEFEELRDLQQDLHDLLVNEEEEEALVRKITDRLDKQDEILQKLLDK